jgi:HSP20 family protein
MTMANIIKKEGNEPRGMARQDPFRLMRDFFADPFGAFQQMAPWGGGEMAWNPSFEVRETDNAYVFKADIPGAKSDDVEVSVFGNRLEVRGKRDQESSQDEGTWHTYERSYGSFARAFTLPDTANFDQITSDLKDGVLTLVVPKKAQSSPQRRKIQIGSGTKH